MTHALYGDEQIATNVLRDRLSSLVEHGLLTKSHDPESKGRTRYGLAAWEKIRQDLRG